MKNEVKVINFMGLRMMTMALSLFLILASITSLFSKGLNLGLDFTGGVAIELGFEKEVDLENIRTVLKGSTEFEKAQVQNYGSNQTVMIKVVGLSNVDSSELSRILNNLLSDFKLQNNFEIKKVDFIGPVVGDELRDQSGIAMLVALFIMLLYVSVRFSMKFALSAILALIHDVIITFGFFSFFQLDFDLTVLAAILAVIGYSLNDTIIVSDRIRENFKKARLESPVLIINSSLSQTLGRTINTSLTTLLTVIALYFFGGEMIKGFSEALLVGIVVGTYSSIYIAGSFLLTLNLNKQDFIEITPEAIDDMP